MANAISPRIVKIGRMLTGARQRIMLAVAAIGLLPLGACELTETLPVQGIFEGSDFVGGAASDEPRAALVARDTLAAGGTAADAAVSLYFALAVTYPSTASLGGGGQCLVYAPTDDGDVIQTLDFLATRSTAAAIEGGRASAVPGAVRGMYALQSRYGKLRWPRLLASAESFARFGHQASRALVHDLTLAADQLFRDPTVRTAFGNKDGEPIAEGQNITQLDLGAVLSTLRTKGPGDFYSGNIARQLVAAVAEAGGTLNLEDLREYRPRWRETVWLPFESHEIHTTPAPSAGGITATAIWALGNDGDRYVESGDADRLHLLAEIGKRGFADRSAWAEGGGGTVLDLERLQASMASFQPDRQSASEALSPAPQLRLENPAATSFTVVDSDGMAVACTVTMNNLFGTGRIAPGTGIVLAAPPRPTGILPLAPVMVVNRVNNQVLLVAGAVGGAAAPSALATVMLEVLNAETPLRKALATPRVHHSGAPDRLAVEQTIGEERRAALAARGHQVVVVPEIGRVNMIHCPGGLPRSPETCRFESDRRGFGLATGGGL
jgi:gamma-glutamyltranspeptidase/glutathione hydrolase